MTPSTTIRTTFRSGLLAVVLLMAGCGGGGTGSDEALPGEPASTTVTATDSTATDSTAPDTTVTTSESAAPTSTTAPEQTTTTTWAPASLVDPPDGFAILGFPGPPSTPADPPTATSDSDHIAAMFSAIADLVLADQRALDRFPVSSFDADAERQGPELIIGSVASSASLGADVHRTIDRFATAAIDADLDPNFIRYWEVRSSAANAFAEFHHAVYDLLEGARTLDRRGFRCVADYLLSESVSCSDRPEAERINEALEELNESFELPREPKDFDHLVPDTPYDPETLERYDICDEWQPTIDRLGPDTTKLFDALVEDWRLDWQFIGRSDCRREAELGGDASWDLQPGQNAFNELYQAVARAGAAAEYDRAVYDNSPKEERDAIARATTTELLRTLQAESTRLLPTIAEPRARLAMASIAYSTTYQNWARDLSEQSVGYTWEEFVAEAFGCDPFESEAECTEEQYDQAASASILLARPPEGAIDWEGAAESLELCALWNGALGSLDEDDARKVAFQIAWIGIGEQIGLEDCSTNFE